MTTKKRPPVCDYEGSDYQTRFWERGGRAYEDGCEELALKKLLPQSGELLLELGAGAGRNTLRYGGYKRIVLLDYSRTQLEQARQKLGESNRYIYVAADIYRLPFVDQLFDGATMIRVIHHMQDVESALGQVRNTLQPGASFILEFANKQNLKAILRYAVHRQSWNPFDQIPVEYAPLNFDFHPRQMILWLTQLGFHVEQILTVSHFRISFLKRFMPTKVLVWLDSLFQWTGMLFQLTPSVFIRASSAGEKRNPGIERNITAFFKCPNCNHAPLEDHSTCLVCLKCSSKWPIEDGIYIFKE